MAVSPTAPSKIARAFDPDAKIALYEIDFSALVGGTRGDPQYTRYFVSDADADGAIYFGGRKYDPMPIKMRERGMSTEGAPIRPSMEIANPMNLVSSLIQSVGGDLAGSYILRRQVYRRHLDDGAEPDSSAQLDPEAWRVEQTVRETKHSIELELAAPFDIDNVELPARRVEFNLCQWTYRDTRCRWNNASPPWFDASDQPVGSINEDVCGLRLQSCLLRFGAPGQSGRQRFGAFPGAARIVR